MFPHQNKKNSVERIAAILKEENLDPEQGDHQPQHREDDQNRLGDEILGVDRLLRSQVERREGGKYAHPVFEGLHDRKRVCGLGLVVMMMRKSGLFPENDIRRIAFGNPVRFMGDHPILT